ncbi:hypothetical protein CsSME_00032582 [Camellia sinensis var. sinensis]
MLCLSLATSCNPIGRVRLSNPGDDATSTTPATRRAQLLTTNDDRVSLRLRTGLASLDRSVCTRITDIEIHFLQIKFTAIGVYLDSEIVGHLQQWKGKTGKDLTEDDDFFEALISVENFLRVVVIKEIKGSQYGVQLESAVRDRSKMSTSSVNSQRREEGQVRMDNTPTVTEQLQSVGEHLRFQSEQHQFQNAQMQKLQRGINRNSCCINGIFILLVIDVILIMKM